MKKTIVTLACALIAPLAFAHTSSTHKRHARHATSTIERITVTGTIIPTPEEGAATAYQPVKTLVIREDRPNPGRFVLNERGHVVDKWGRVPQTSIKPGTRVLIYYANMGRLRMVDHVVVLD
jgi:hypothetical protein